MLTQADLFSTMLCSAGFTLKFLSIIGIIHYKSKKKMTIFYRLFAKIAQDNVFSPMD